MKCIVSLSGGRDSATCLGLAVDRYGKENVYAVGFEYGSTHPQEIECAKKIAAYYEVPYQVIAIGPSIFMGSTCTMLKGATKEIQKGKTYEEILAEKEGKVDTYVPFRNGLFSAFIAARAESLVQEFDEDVIIMLGQHADDSGYYVDENGNEMLDESKAAYPDAVRRGSKVLMGDGFQKNIEDIRVGDIVWAFNENTRRLEQSTVTGVYNKGIKKVYNACDNLWVSGDHIMWVAKQKFRFRPYSSLNRKSANYCIPTIPYALNDMTRDIEMYKRGYLHGFIDGDGWIATNPNPHICACQKYVDVLEEIVSMWRELYNDKDININSKKTPYDYDMHYVSLGGREIIEKFNNDYFMENIDFCQGYLNGIMIAEGWCSYNKAAKRNSLALCQNIYKNSEVCARIDTCIKLLNMFPAVWFDKTSCKNWQFSNYLSFPLKYGASKLHTLISNICAYYTSTGLHSKNIVTIDNAIEEEDECYDITTTAGTFIADGVLVHNCTVSFVKAFEEVVKISSVGRVHYEAPFVKKHKWELLVTGMTLKKPVPYNMCLSCYDPVVDENGEVHECGKCATCLDVQSNMEKALKYLEEHK